jgi:dUTP pyrophosphatase
MNKRTLQIFKLHVDVCLPTRQTADSACLDIRAFLPNGGIVQFFDYNNTPQSVIISDRGLLLQPNYRYLIPTGLIFDIPLHCSVRLHVRSGMAYKFGLQLANGEGIVDSDYINPIFLIVINTSCVPVTIGDGDRIAQAEMIVDNSYEVIESSIKPLQKTDRSGGLGSTGVK